MTTQVTPRTGEIPHPGRLLGWIGLTMLAVLVVGTRDEFAAIAVPAIANLAALAVAARRLRPIALSPPYIVASSLTLIALAGYFFTNVLAGSGGTAGTDVRLSTDSLQSTATQLLVGSTVLVLAACLMGGRPPADVKASDLPAVFAGLAKYSGPILFIGCLHVLMLVMFLGIGPMLIRDDRLVGRGSSIEAAAQMLAVGMVVAVGIVFFTNRGPVRAFAFVLLSTYALYFFSLGSRRLALIPILLLLAQVLSRGGRLRPSIVLAVGIISPVLLALPLHLRGLPRHGLIPYFDGLPSFVLAGDSFLTSLNNIMAGFKITALTAESGSIPVQWLWVSINPMFGIDAGWYEISGSLRINRFTPYTAAGELMNYGGMVFILGFAGLGLVLGLIHRFNMRLLQTDAGRFAAIAVLGLTVVFSVQFPQYNLRSNVRYIYLILLIQAAGFVLNRMRSRSSGLSK